MLSERELRPPESIERLPYKIICYLHADLWKRNPAKIAADVAGLRKDGIGVIIHATGIEQYGKREQGAAIENLPQKPKSTKLLPEVSYSMGHALAMPLITKALARVELTGAQILIDDRHIGTFFPVLTTLLFNKTVPIISENGVLMGVKEVRRQKNLLAEEFAARLDTFYKSTFDLRVKEMEV